MRTGLVLAVAALLISAACGDSGSPTTTSEIGATTVAAPTTTAPQSTTSNPAAGSTATSSPAATTTVPAPPTTAAATATTTTPATTTTTEPATTTTVPTAVFTITGVVFGDNGFVKITNVGQAAGDIGGYWICQRPAYFEIPAQVLEPGDSVWIASGEASSAGSSTAVAVFSAEGRLGQFSPRAGEVALYANSSFSNADSIRSFVEWGPEGGLPRAGRSGVAVEAGLWEAGAFVVVPDGATAVTATTPPTDGPDEWIADLGG